MKKRKLTDIIQEREDDFRRQVENSIRQSPTFGISRALSEISIGHSLQVALDESTIESNNPIEATYGGYHRIAIPRSAEGWRVRGNTASNANSITFPECRSGNCTIRSFRIITEDGKTLIIQNLTSPINIIPRMTPEFAPGDLLISF